MANVTFLRQRGWQNMTEMNLMADSTFQCKWDGKNRTPDGKQNFNAEGLINSNMTKMNVLANTTKFQCKRDGKIGHLMANKSTVQKG